MSSIALVLFGELNEPVHQIRQNRLKTILSLSSTDIQVNQSKLTLTGLTVPLTKMSQNTSVYDAITFANSFSASVTPTVHHTGLQVIML